MTNRHVKVYKEQGGNVLVIRAKDGGVIKGQATEGATPAQASHIADATTSYSFTTGAAFNSAIALEIETAVNAIAGKVNSLIAVAENTGLTATS